MSKNPNTFSLALVTGATSGIGKAFCYLLASKGINLIITGRDISRLNHVAETLREKVNVLAFDADLAKPEGRARIVEHIHAYSPDLVVNNAGFGLYGKAVKHPTSVQLEMLNVDSNVPLELTLEAAKVLISHNKPGVILNIASAAAFYTFPSFAVYSAAKSCVVQYSKALDIELQANDIRVLVACPGMVSTDFGKRAALGKSKGTKKFSMSAQFAAEELWWQIQKGKRCHVFDWKYRWGGYLGYFMPDAILTPILQRLIEGRL